MKKFIAALSATVMVIGAVAGLTACGESTHDHVWDDGAITTPATCTTEGVKTYKCTVEGCTETYTEAVDKLAHDFANGALVNVDNDVHAKKCANCEAVDSANTAPHNFVEDTEKSEPATCHSDGTKYFVCSDCGAEKTEGITDRPAHAYGEGEDAVWVSVDDDNHAKQCKNDGCGYIDTENKVAHTYSDTYESDGDEHWRVCSDCKHEEQHLTHTWDEGVITIRPELMKEGEKTYTCSACKKTKTEKIDAGTTHAAEFSTDSENNPWGYGKMDITKWDDGDFQYTLIPATGTTADAYTGDGVEIKGGWLSGGGSYISYTVSEDLTLKIDVTCTRVDGGKRMDVRVVNGNEARYHGDYSAEGKLSFSESYTLSAGDTVYLVFTAKGDDTGFDQTDFTISLSVIA